MHEYTLNRSNRKSVALSVRADATVEIRAPLKMPRAAIDKFVASKENWINNKILLMRERIVKKETFSLSYGAAVLVRGKEYPIAPRLGDRIGFDDQQFYMPPNLSPEQIKSACVEIYKLVAKKILTIRTLDFARRMGIMPSAVRITSAKTRWGSCSAQKSINYSWRLIMAEDDVIDYVVVHELAHITEMNHSDKFWAIVARVLPDYTARQDRLKVLQRRLGCENWE